MHINKTTEWFYTGLEKQTVWLHTAIYLFLFKGKNKNKTKVIYFYDICSKKIDIVRLHFRGTCE